jgi:hypothetical protein
VTVALAVDDAAHSYTTAAGAAVTVAVPVELATASYVTLPPPIKPNSVGNGAAKPAAAYDGEAVTVALPVDEATASNVDGPDDNNSNNMV